MERLLICTDLDRTLISNGVQPESPNARRRFSELASRPEVKLAYVSGRHRVLVQQAIDIYNLPLPDYVIGDVGTTIYQVVGPGHWPHISAWEEEIGVDWSGSSHDDLKSLFADINDLRPQEASKQNRFKLSYYVPMHADRRHLMQVMEERLQRIEVQANMVWSVDEPAGVGLLDLLPPMASKLHAVEFLMGLLGFDETNTVFAGDSGNDMEVLVSTVPSVLVANSQWDVKEMALRGAYDNGNSDRIYLAEGGTLGMNGNYAAGILEGVAHYHPHILQESLEADA
ncbi:HAD-IIB family hydrolase [Solemya velesiana gill symbiont]|uniref:Haloacid dehalogenase n=1 Tax=Solemya velesiana gill symbiont TaxID=1918948 RepID=A0A1T2KS13_9GAMM|nr:haloacid dehalogenase [Solemya velesiana gill symbiont]